MIGLPPSLSGAAQVTVIERGAPVAATDVGEPGASVRVAVSTDAASEESAASAEEATTVTV